MQLIDERMDALIGVYADIESMAVYQYERLDTPLRQKRAKQQRAALNS